MRPLSSKLIVYVSTAILCGAILAFFIKEHHSRTHPKYRVLPPSSIVDMERRRLFVAKLVSDKLPGEQITGTENDFNVLQHILDANLLKKEQTWELQSLGIVFGDALIKRIKGLHWMEVSDEYGTDPILNYLDTTLMLSPKTMLSKRVEDGEKVELNNLVNGLATYVADHAKEAGKRSQYDEVKQ